MGGPLKYFFMSRGTPIYEYENTNKEAVDNARTLLQYWQLADKYFCDMCVMKPA
jgi:hypothetical protein